MIESLMLWVQSDEWRYYEFGSINLDDRTHLRS